MSFEQKKRKRKRSSKSLVTDKGVLKKVKFERRKVVNFFEFFDPCSAPHFLWKISDPGQNVVKKWFRSHFFADKSHTEPHLSIIRGALVPRALIDRRPCFRESYDLLCLFFITFGVICTVQLQYF